MINKKRVIIAIFLLLQISSFAGNIEQAEKKQIYTVHYTNIPDIYVAAGTVESRTEANISPRITARTINVYVRDGNHVKKNQLLIKLEDSILQASVLETESHIDSINARISSADNSVKSAEAVFELADTEFKRNNKLYSSKAISQKQYEQTVSNYKKASAELNRARQNVLSLVAEKKAVEQVLSRSKTLFTYSEIKSPIDGIVGEIAVDPGDLAIPGKILMKIFDPSKLLLEIPVRESLIKEIKIGEEIVFEVKALSRKYKGQIREIVPYVDTKTRTFLVKVCIDHSKGLVPGMYGIARIVIGSKKVLLIPKNAITRIGQVETVLLKKDNIVSKVFISSIKSSTPNIQIVLSGLDENDKIIVDK
jgi:HlyD family secretion protein